MQGSEIEVSSIGHELKVPLSKPKLQRDYVEW